MSSKREDDGVIFSMEISSEELFGSKEEAEAWEKRMDKLDANPALAWRYARMAVNAQPDGSHVSFQVALAKGKDVRRIFGTNAEEFSKRYGVGVYFENDNCNAMISGPKRNVLAIMNNFKGEVIGNEASSSVLLPGF